MFDGIAKKRPVIIVEKGFTVSKTGGHMGLAGDNALQITAADVMVAEAAAVETLEGRHAQADWSLNFLNCGLHFCRN